MKTYGLLGEKLTHSFSPQIHGMLADYNYELFPVSRDNVKAFIKSGDFLGLNVTIPYKETVLPFCKTLSDTAKRIGSVNTVVVDKNGDFYGYNTDYFGFVYLIKKSGICVKNKKALVLGSGGSSKTVCVVLKDLGAKEVTVISRNGENNYHNLEINSDAGIIINTTPVGMYPNNGKSPVDLSVFPNCRGVIDIIYNPCNTALILDAQRKNIPCISGLHMLVAQAKASSELFTGNTINDDVIDRITNKINNQMKNIILIGMPGCGKSTVAENISGLTGREFLDTDKIIEDNTKRSIPDIILNDGEDTFRTLETSALEYASKQSGKVIATGGGIVLKSENLPLLKQNSTVIFLSRSVEELEIPGRPLSKDLNTLKTMYKERLPLYQNICDFEVCVDPSADITANKILKLLTF